MDEEQIAWQLGGLTTDGGGLDRPMPTGDYYVPPRIEVEGNYLAWWRSVLRNGVRHLGKFINPPDDLLDRFMRLDTASPLEVCDFAGRYGLLTPTPSLERTLASLLKPPRPPKRYEELSYWRWLQAYFRAVLNAAARLHQGRSALTADWQAIECKGPPEDVSPSDRSALRQGKPLLGPWLAEVEKLPALDDQRSYIAHRVNILLMMGRVEPEFRWGRRIGSSNREPRIKLVPRGGLMGALAMQLSLTISRSNGLAECSSCHELYIPKRRPRSDQSHFCKKCGKRASWRLSKQRAAQKRTAGDE